MPKFNYEVCFPKPGFEKVEFDFANSNGKAKPFIALSMPDTPSNQKHLLAIQKEVLLWGEGKIQIEEEVYPEDVKWFKVRITGKPAILFIIDKLLYDSQYASKENHVAKKALKKFKNKLINQDFSVNHPAKARPSHRYVDTAKLADVRSANTVKKVIEDSPAADTANEERKLAFKKETKGKLSEVEALAAAYFRLFMGYDRAPVMYSLQKGDKRDGVVASALPSYISFIDALSDTLSAKLLIEAGVAEMLVASWLFEDTDVNTNNWGFVDSNGRKKVARIDFDHAFWPFTCKYHGFAPQEIQPWNNISVKPNEAFPITKEDILNFPDIRDAKPFCWPDGLRKLKNNPVFTEKKWKYFLKAILLNEQSAIQAIANAYLGSDKAQQLYGSHANKRLAMLKNILTTLPEFHNYLAAHPEVISELCNEFTEYNQKEPDQALWIDCKAIQTAYANLITNVEHEPAYRNQLALQTALKHLDDEIATVGANRQAHVTAIRDHVIALNKTKPLSKVTLLTNVIHQTADVMNIVDPVKDKKKLAQYHALANKVQGHSSLGWKLLGSALIGLGVLVTAAGALIATTTLLPSFGLGTVGGSALAAGGIVLAATGFGLFKAKGRENQLTKGMTTLKEIIKHEKPRTR